MTEAEVAECKKYAESKGFVLFHYSNELSSEDIIYMDNVDKWYYMLCNFFDDVVTLHHIRYRPEESCLNMSIRSDEVETVDEFKVLLDDLVKRWKAYKEDIKLHKLKEDF